MAIHIGKYIHDEIKQQGMPVKVFAAKINRSRNVAYGIFKRESVDTFLLNKISRVLKFDFFSVYSAQREYNNNEFRTFLVAEPGELYEIPDRELINQLKQETILLKKEVEYLKKILSLIETKKRSKF